MVRGVIFDMDGLMLDTERIAVEGWRRAGRHLGVEIREDVLNGMRGLNQKTGREYVLSQLGQDFDYETARNMRTSFVKEYIDQNGVPLKKGLRELLSFLKAQGIPAALATSTGRAQAQAWLEQAEVFSYFSASLCGAEGGNSKPEPDIFLKAAELLGVPAAECIVLEDSNNGLIAACRAGSMAVVVPDLTEPSEEILSGCYARCESLLDVIPLIQRIND